jgi:site-specific recombinase XerD
MNLNQTFNILFWLNRAKIKRGQAPIWVRITIDGRRAECSTSRRIAPEHWDSSTGQVKLEAEGAAVINEYLLVTRAEINKHYNILLSTKEFVTVEDVKNSYKGIREKVLMFKDVFDQFKQIQLERMQSNDISLSRYRKWNQLGDAYSEFVKFKYKRSDLPIKEMRIPFVNEFYHHLRTKRNLIQNTAMKRVRDIKQVMDYAVMQEYLIANPFASFKFSFRPTTRTRLSMEEIELLANKPISIARLDEVRDCYLFVCYTGYSYKQLYELTWDNVQLGIDGRKWIIKTRSKSKDSKENVPLLRIPLRILEKYKNHPYCVINNKLLPVNTNQNYNFYLKELADLCEIAKCLTTHTARHTFATTIMLDNGVPIETISKMLGHRDLKTTQVYAEITDKRISEDTLNLERKLTSRENANYVRQLG